MSGQKNLATIFIIKTGRKHNKILWSQETGSSWTDRTEQYASKEECIKRNKWRMSVHSSFQGLQENEKENIPKFRRPPKLADKVS